MKNIVHSLLTGAFQQRDLTLESGQEIVLGSSQQFQTIRVITGLGELHKNKEKQEIKTSDLIQILPGYNVQIKATGHFALEVFKPAVVIFKINSYQSRRFSIGGFLYTI